MLYSTKHGWCFIHVPKNGGTSIVKPNRRNKDCEYISQIARPPSVCGSTYHNKWSYYKKLDIVKNLTPVAILRNPWARCLSLYLFNIHEASRKIGHTWAKIDHGRLVHEGFKKAWMPGGFFRDEHGRKFEYIEGGRQWAQDDAQHTWLDGEGKWFRLEDQLEDFCKFTKLPMPRKMNATTHTAYQNYYDDELIEEIRVLYQKDIELGGYTYA